MTKLSVRGFTVVEAMVGVAIISVVALSIVYLLGNNTEPSRQNSLQSCQQLADASMELIRSAGTGGAYDYSNSNDRVFNSDEVPRVVFLPTQLDRGLTDPMAQQRLSLESMQVTTLAGLDQLYNSLMRSGRNVCASYVEMPHFKSSLSQINHALSQAVVGLRIRPIELSTSSPVACPNQLFTRPRAVPGSSSLMDQTPPPFNIQSRSDVGYLVEIQVTYPDSTNSRLTKTCSTSQKFFHGQEPPLQFVQTQPASGSSVLLTRYSNIACDSPNYLPDATATFKKSKTGTAFLCQYAEQIVPPQPALQLPEFCQGKGCPGLQTRQFNIPLKALTNQPGWFDCRELMRRNTQCVGGQITTQYDPSNRAYSIRVPRIAEHCQIKIDVAEVDYALNISSMSAQAIIEHFGRRPGQFSCQCQATDGSPRNWYVCDSRYTANDCPRPNGIIGTPSESITSSPFLSACECFPNSCACNPSLCIPPEPPEPIEPGNGGGGGGSSSQPSPTPSGSLSGTPTPTPTGALGSGTPTPTPTSISSPTPTATPTSSACETCMRNYRSCSNSCAQSCQSSANPSSCQNNCASSCGGCDRQCQILNP